MTSPAPPAIGLPIPSSWYCLGLARSLPRGGIWRRRLAGRDLVVFRSESGAVAALDAFCPHLGADLSVGGSVKGETLRCGFHGFCFGRDGGCASTPYGKKVPPAAQARTAPAVEVNGLIMVWHGAAGEAPTFDIAPISTDGWTDWREASFEVRGHPQEIAENSADVGHFAAVHDYADLAPDGPPRIDGAALRVAYTFRRTRALLGMSGQSIRIEVLQHGLGYALVESLVCDFDLHVRQLVMTQPLGDDRVHLRIAMSVDRNLAARAIHPLLAWVPSGWLAERIADHGMGDFRADVQQDVPIWSHKIHLPRPALADGDGPIGTYRKWCRRFYPSVEGGAEAS